MRTKCEFGTLHDYHYCFGYWTYESYTLKALTEKKFRGRVGQDLFNIDIRHTTVNNQYYTNNIFLLSKKKKNNNFNLSTTTTNNVVNNIIIIDK